MLKVKNQLQESSGNLYPVYRVKSTVLRTYSSNTFLLSPYYTTGSVDTEEREREVLIPRRTYLDMRMVTGDNTQRLEIKLFYG